MIGPIRGPDPPNRKGHPGGAAHFAKTLNNPGKNSKRRPRTQGHHSPALIRAAIALYAPRRLR
jgi:hypothetical protein